MNKLTTCQRKLIELFPDKYTIQNGKFKNLFPNQEETTLEFFIIETYGE